MHPDMWDDWYFNEARTRLESAVLHQSVNHVGFAAPVDRSTSATVKANATARPRDPRPARRRPPRPPAGDLTMKNRLRPFSITESPSYVLNFSRIECPGSGYGFDCTVDGVVDVEALTPIQRESWADAQSDEFYAPEVLKYPNRYVDPGSVRCGCGHEHDLSRGDSSCDNCGQWFNTCGQQLVDPEHWED